MIPMRTASGLGGLWASNNHSSPDSPRLHTSRVLGGIAASAILMLTAFAVVQTPRAVSAAFLLALAIALFSGMRILSLGWQRTPDTIGQFFYLFVFTWMGIAPMAQITAEVSPLGTYFPVELHVRALQLVLGSLFAYELGRRVRRHSINQPPRLRCLHPPKLRIASMATLALTPVVLFMIGGPAVLFTSRSELSQAIFIDDSSKAVGGALNALLLVPPFVTTYAWLSYRRVVRRKGEGVKGLDRLLCWAAISMNLAVNNPIGQSRFWIATVYISLMFAMLGWQRTVVVRLIAVMAIVGVVFIFPYAAIFRHSGTERLTVSRVSPSEQFLWSGDFDAYTQLVAALSYVGDYGRVGPNSLISSLLFFVPRSIWTGKAEDTGKVLGRYQELRNINLSAPLWAEAYISLGAPLVLCTFFALGSLHRRLLRSWSSMTSLVPIASVYQFVILRGSLLQSMGVTLILIILGLFISAPRSHTTGADSS
jgi:hypothetical protein